jgi:hypothetical protein
MPPDRRLSEFLGNRFYCHFMFKRFRSVITTVQVVCMDKCAFSNAVGCQTMSFYEFGRVFNGSYHHVGQGRFAKKAPNLLVILLSCTFR